MSRPYIDIMTVSLTINVCILVYNLVPRLRIKALATPALSRYKTITAVCRNYADKPLDLARILTNQLLLWLLILLSLFAICSCDVIKYPFSFEITSTWRTTLIETLFAVNIGRYAFIVTEKFLFKRIKSKAQFRADIVHHSVTVTCYVLFLAYGQNLLLGLVGIVIESTTVCDEIGRFCKDHERIHTKFYRRLVVINCVGAICFRGIIPSVFLIMAMFQQSPFTMGYVPLMVFFLSIIFFSVINVWQILSSIQRLMKRIYEKTHDVQLTRMPELGQSGSTSRRHKPRRSTRLKFDKNNLGYLRPYDNKNIANYIDEKDNLNNRKEFAKETVGMYVNPEVLLSPVKVKNTNAGATGSHLAARNQTSPTEERQSLGHAVRTPTVLFFCERRPLRESNSTTDSSQSDSALLPETLRDSNNSTVSAALNNGLVRHSVENVQSPLEPRFSIVRSLSLGNVANTCGDTPSIAPI